MLSDQQRERRGGLQSGLQASESLVCVPGMRSFGVPAQLGPFPSLLVLEHFGRVDG